MFLDFQFWTRAVFGLGVGARFRLASGNNRLGFVTGGGEHQIEFESHAKGYKLADCPFLQQESDGCLQFPSQPL